MNGEREEIVLGNKVRDTVTEFEGVVTAITRHIGGYLGIQVTALVSGEPKEHWIEAGRLVHVEAE